LRKRNILPEVFFTSQLKIIVIKYILYIIDYSTIYLRYCQVASRSDEMNYNVHETLMD